jgi:hypothetical protein
MILQKPVKTEASLLYLPIRVLRKSLALVDDLNTFQFTIPSQPAVLDRGSKILMITEGG